MDKTKSRLYRIWSAMKNRCINPKRDNYKYYGGKGIEVCAKWKESYDEFKKWSDNNGYNEKLTIDRIDSNGNYCPENCRWITTEKQNNNRSDNRYATINGETKTASEWSKQYDLDHKTFLDKLDAGITGQELLVRKRKKKVKWKMNDVIFIPDFIIK